MLTTPTPGRANLGIPVAEYVRMSTRGQFLSPAKQSAAISAYADANGMRVVQSYLDSGRSGLDLGGRPALQRLLSDVRAGLAEFEFVLVYDVSRWGRFQNADEAAFYEYLCMLGGVRVIYVAEPFSADDSPLAAILKGLKRTMAAEFSRELSVKVFTGQARLVRMGFRQGSSPGYGLRRLLLDVTGRPKGRLDVGQRKSFTTDRVILTPGPAKELRVVNRIFREYIDGLSQCEIARRLNSERLPGVCGKRWTQQSIRSIVTNEKYIGNNIFNRCSKSLRRPKTLKPENEWIRCNGAFKAIVPEAVFWKAQAEMNRRHHIATDEEMLAPIRRLLKTRRPPALGSGSV